jgi:serine/threonine-protein kinase
MILYELIAGKPPYDVKAMSMVDVVKVVCKVDPVAPSAAARAELAKDANGGTGVTWRVPRDLDAIVLKALEKAPSRRYGSVAGFADDLRRFLDGRPVRARPDTLFYRGSKFVRRNALVAGLGSAAMVALMIGMITTTWQSRIAQAERDRSEAEAARKTAALDFLLGTLGVFDPDRLGGQITFSHEDLIDAGLQQLETLSREPEIRAPVMNTLAQLIFNLGERSRADSLYNEAYGMLEPYAPHPDQAVSLMGIGLVRLRDLRRDEAIEAYRRALAIRRELLPAGDPAIAESMASLAFALYTIGASANDPRADAMLSEAETLYRNTLTTLTEPTVLRARALEGLGDIEQERASNPRTAEDSASVDGLLASAEGHYKEAIQTGVFASNDTTPENARRMWGLAAISDARGNPDEAVEASRQALAALERTYDESHPDVALAHYYLGRYLDIAKRYADAAASYERYAELSAANLDSRSSYTGLALWRAGQARLEASQPSQAIPDLERSIRWYQAAIETGEVSESAASDDLGRAHTYRGKAFAQLGNRRAAVDDYRSALRILGRELERPQLTPTRVSEVRQLAFDASTLLAEVFDLLQQRDSASFYRARAATLSSP